MGYGTSPVPLGPLRTLTLYLSIFFNLYSSNKKKVTRSSKHNFDQQYILQSIYTKQKKKIWYCETNFQDKFTHIIFLTYNLDLPEDVHIQIQKV